MGGEDFVTSVTAAYPLNITNGRTTPHITIQAASESQDGYLTADHWTIFHNKLGVSSNFGGDISGTVSNISVNRIKNTTLLFSSLSDGHILKYSGDKWINSMLTTSDIPGLSNKIDYSQIPICTPSQTLTFTSPLGGFTCTTIHLTGSQVSGNITGNLIGDVVGSASHNVLKSGDTMTGHLTHSANFGNIYKSSTGEGSVILQGSTSGDSNYVLRLPATQSIGIKALANDGAGNLFWKDFSDGSVVSVSATSPLISSGGGTPSLSLAGLNGLGTASQLLGMNSTGNAYEYKSFEGVSNQINISHTANSVIISTPQDLHPAATPVFSSMTLSSLGSPGFVKNNALGVLSGGNKINATSDISGVLPIVNGGTGTSSFSNNKVIASDGSGNLIGLEAGTSNAILQQSTSGPTWTATTYPSTISANQLLYSSGTNTITGLASANKAVLVTNESGTPGFLSITNDFLSQYVMSSGRPDGQSLAGGTAGGETLTLKGTNNASAGSIVMNPNGGNVGIGTTNPSEALHVTGKVKIGTSRAIGRMTVCSKATLTATYPAGDNIYNWTASDCDNGYPNSTCVGYISKAVISGFEHNLAALIPNERLYTSSTAQSGTNGGFGYSTDTSTSGNGVLDIRVMYMCNN